MTPDFTVLNRAISPNAVSGPLADSTQGAALENYRWTLVERTLNIAEEVRHEGPGDHGTSRTYKAASFCVRDLQYLRRL